jgi:translation initiation factor 6 (eIF-6)
MTRGLYSKIRNQCNVIEEKTQESELEVLKKEDEAFMVRKGEIDISRLVSQQQAEVNRRDAAFKATITARDVRKKCKQVLRTMSRETKVTFNLRRYRQAYF